MQIDFAFLADSATQRPDGRVDALAIGPFTATQGRFPASVLHFAVVARVGFTQEDRDRAGTLHVRVVAPDGATVAEQQSAVEAPPIFVAETEGRRRTRVLNFYNVPLPAPGTYVCNVALNGDQFDGDVHFEANLAPAV